MSGGDPRVQNLAKILVGYSTQVKEDDVVAIDGDWIVHVQVCRGPANILDILLKGELNCFQIGSHFKESVLKQRSLLFREYLRNHFSGI